MYQMKRGDLSLTPFLCLQVLQCSSHSSSFRSTSSRKTRQGRVKCDWSHEKTAPKELGGFFVSNKRHGWVKLLIRWFKFNFKDDQEVPFTSFPYLCCFRCRYSNSWSPSFCFSWLIFVWKTRLDFLKYIFPINNS